LLTCSNVFHVVLSGSDTHAMVSDNSAAGTAVTYIHFVAFNYFCPFF